MHRQEFHSWSGFGAVVSVTEIAQLQRGFRITLVQGPTLGGGQYVEM
jgi:hypothetical protein